MGSERNNIDFFNKFRIFTSQEGKNHFKPLKCFIMLFQCLTLFLKFFAKYFKCLAMLLKYYVLHYSWHVKSYDIVPKHVKYLFKLLKCLAMLLKFLVKPLKYQ